MKPISESHLIDNMKFMQQFEDGFFELAIVDPPYGIGATNMQMGSAPNRNEKGQYSGESTAVKLRKNRLNSGGGKLNDRIINNSNCEWDETPPPPEYFKELFRVSKNQIIWGGNYFALPPTRGMICWDKLQPWDNFSQFELAWTSFDKPAAMYRLSNTGGANKEKKIHPTQKPLKIYKWLLDKYTQPDDKILDTHMGSQSSRIAAYKMGFDYWGCEIDEQYYNDGNKRFKIETSQLAMF